jgi:hypothetical protein
MNYHRKSTRIVLLATLCLVAVVTITKLSKASIGNINKGDLSGPWQITLSGNTGCGLVSMLATATLNASGTGPATITTHGQCGDSVTTGQSFTITSLNSNGSGTAGLTCGPSCGWTLTIQVSPERSTMNLADIDKANVNNWIAGMAVHQ